MLPLCSQGSGGWGDKLPFGFLLGERLDSLEWCGNWAACLTTWHARASCPRPLSLTNFKDRVFQNIHFYMY